MYLMYEDKKGDDFHRTQIVRVLQRQTKYVLTLEEFNERLLSEKIELESQILRTVREGSSSQKE